MFIRNKKDLFLAALGVRGFVRDRTEKTMRTVA